MADLAFLAVLISYLVFLTLDALRPKRAFPRIARWKMKGITFFVVSMAIGIAAPFLWADFVAANRLVDGTALGDLGGFAVGLLVTQLAVYGYHRACHRFDFLWRWSHQLHHSAERVDIYGAMLFHPFESFVQALLGAVTLNLVLGLTPEAAGLTGATMLFFALFQHANIRTPRWLGYFIQRPEAHCVHHERGLHAYNYADLPLWDLIFGTFRNPESWAGEAGFEAGGSQKLGAMLAGRDVSAGTGTRVLAEPATLVERAA